MPFVSHMLPSGKEFEISVIPIVVDTGNKLTMALATSNLTISGIPINLIKVF